MMEGVIVVKLNQLRKNKKEILVRGFAVLYCLLVVVALLAYHAHYRSSRRQQPTVIQTTTRAKVIAPILKIPGLQTYISLRDKVHSDKYELEQSVPGLQTYKRLRGRCNCTNQETAKDDETTSKLIKVTSSKVMPPSSITTTTSPVVVKKNAGKKLPPSAAPENKKNSQKPSTPPPSTAKVIKSRAKPLSSSIQKKKFKLKPPSPTRPVSRTSRCSRKKPVPRNHKHAVPVIPKRKIIQPLKLLIRRKAVETLVNNTRQALDVLQNKVGKVLVRNTKPKRSSKSGEPKATKPRKVVPSTTPPRPTMTPQRNGISYSLLRGSSRPAETFVEMKREVGKLGRVGNPLIFKNTTNKLGPILNQTAAAIGTQAHKVGNVTKTQVFKVAPLLNHTAVLVGTKARKVGPGLNHTVVAIVQKATKVGKKTRILLAKVGPMMNDTAENVSIQGRKVANDASRQVVKFQSFLSTRVLPAIDHALFITTREESPPHLLRARSTTTCHVVIKKQLRIAKAFAVGKARVQKVRNKLKQKLQEKLCEGCSTTTR